MSLFLIGVVAVIIALGLWLMTGGEFYKITALGIAIILCMFATYESDKDYTPAPKPLTKAQLWEKFKQDNDCKIIEKREGHSTGGLGISSSGHVIGMMGDDVPDQVAYLCKDGVTYWKNEK